MSHNTRRDVVEVLRTLRKDVDELRRRPAPQPTKDRLPPLAVFSAPGTFSTGSRRKFFHSGVRAMAVEAWRDVGSGTATFTLSKNGTLFATISLTDTALKITPIDQAFGPGDYITFEITAADGSDLQVEVYG